VVELTMLVERDAVIGRGREKCLAHRLPHLHPRAGRSARHRISAPLIREDIGTAPRACPAGSR
jgi:hypothetical protein